ncbi:hypothetical protein [Salinispora tropica]|uniref:Uncharacterized protein n=1 Tax=Salinispora tropica (strain ATCC BAA-916 / DSM 44818 / JCM 13857 / NBRC 105044 / CNB-440) TaxID=369723 RepID=A4X1F6_SALTO|nr:hypothetical protein [Salinispora tropica]ABP52706.1 hypothetical protein Strop_0221 [Salinispora tropica CNB-440]
MTSTGTGPTPNRPPGADDSATASTSDPAPGSAGMTADGAASAAVPGAGMSAETTGAPAGATPGSGMRADGGSRVRTAEIVPGPGGVMTDEVGVITGELTLRTEYLDGQVALRVQYREADEWYVVTGGRATLPDPAGLDAVHAIAVALLDRPDG